MGLTINLLCKRQTIPNRYTRQPVSQRISSKLYTLDKLNNWIRMGSKNGKPVLTEDQAEALAQSNGLTVDQVKEQFEAFKTEHPNGKMKRKDFKEMMSKALPKKDANK